MTQLRDRMVEDMQLRGFSPRTQQSYAYAVSQLAAYYKKSPDQVSEAELRRYFLYLKNEKKASRSACTVALCGIKFFFEQTLQQEWPLFDLVRPPKEKKLPVVLSQAEVRRILAQVTQPQYQVCLRTIYACGLRVREATQLQIADVDSDRLLLHIRQGKGNKDRYVPLTPATLTQLRHHWLTHRHPCWLFPGRAQSGKMVTAPVSPSSVQRAFRSARNAAGIQKPATVHTLRHSWATHLLEAGVNLRFIQRWLGHKSLQSTARYTHLTRPAMAIATDTLNRLLADLDDHVDDCPW